MARTASSTKPVSESSYWTMRSRTSNYITSGLHLGHDPQEAAIRVFEERHPLLGAVGMLEDHVGRSNERRAACLQLSVGGVDVIDAEVEHGIARGGAFVSAAEKEPGAIAVEK